MNTLILLAISSIIWGAALSCAALMLQKNANVSGRARQWIWRGATALLLAPWLAAPAVSALGLGLGAAQLAPIIEEPTADLVSAAMAVNAGHAEPGVVENGGGVLAWLAGLNWLDLAVGALIAGWIVRFVVAQVAVRSLLGIVSKSRDAEPGPATMALAGWTQKLGLRRAPKLRVVKASVSPFSYGVLRAVICLPEGLEYRLSREALELVIGHECLHVASGDGWRRPLERITADVFWFNPFAWLIRRELDMARELACDEGVVELSNARHAYARTLRDVADFSAGLSHTIPAASMSLAGGRSLMLRVTRTLALARRKPARSAVIAACLLGLVGAPIAVAQVMLATPAPPAPPAAPAQPPEPPALEQQVYVSPDGMVRASFSATVTSASGGAASGYSVGLQGVGRNGDGDACLAELAGLGGLEVAKGQTIEPGAAIGKRGSGGSMSFTVRCSDDADADGRAVANMTPPAPPAPPAQVEPAGAVAPVAPTAPVEALAPPAPPSPPAPAAAPRHAPAPVPAPTPRSPRAWDRSAPAPLAVPLTPPTPVTPFTPATPKAPVALNGKQQTAITTPSDDRVLAVEPLNGAGALIKLQQSSEPVRIRQAVDKATFRLNGETSPVLEQSADITSRFGYIPDPFTGQAAFHQGVDLGGPAGLAVHAPAAAVVTFAGEKGANGNVVEVGLGDGVSMRFTHLDEITVAEGDVVKAGDAIGTIGTTGRTTGAHVHVEIQRSGKAYDPESVENLTLSAR